ncbi:hypothetical protein [Rubrobacter indicoceani]|uniref:hypothetical protein n=1 Tax=Rubrobacter indicoceani TaxID=2051957 RepID=UPI000E5AE634|nr:hypothetical protein [Rubrobacter indicoceani]
MRGYPAPRLWSSAFGGEVVYEVDLPGCCEHDARSYRDAFECAGCGASWRPVGEVPPEACGFIVESGEEEWGAA